MNEVAEPKDEEEQRHKAANVVSGSEFCFFGRDFRTRFLF
jgi:hypothetical protein